MPDEPLKHLLRAAPPWETREYTQCGRQAEKLATTTVAEMNTVIKRHGRQRAAYTHCMTCIETQQRYASWRLEYDEHGNPQRRVAVPMTWESAPADVISRWVERARYREPEDADRLRRTLHAIGALVEAHADEFAAMVDADGVVDLTARRRTKGGARA